MKKKMFYSIYLAFILCNLVILIILIRLIIKNVFFMVKKFGRVKSPIGELTRARGWS